MHVICYCFISGRSSPPTSPRAAPYLHSHPGAAQPVSVSPESTKKYRNPATIPETFSTTVDSRGSHSDLSSRSSSQSSLSLASTLSPQQTGGMNVGRLEPLVQTPSEGDDTSSELFSPTTWQEKSRGLYHCNNTNTRLEVLIASHVINLSLNLLSLDCVMLSLSLNFPLKIASHNLFSQHFVMQLSC